MRSDLRSGKTVITLHEADKRVLSKARDMLRFVATNTREGHLNCAADTGAQAIDGVMRSLLAETPDVDTPAETVLPEVETLPTGFRGVSGSTTAKAGAA